VGITGRLWVDGNDSVERSGGLGSAVVWVNAELFPNGFDHVLLTIGTLNQVVAFFLRKRTFMYHHGNKSCDGNVWFRSPAS